MRSRIKQWKVGALAATVVLVGLAACQEQATGPRSAIAPGSIRKTVAVGQAGYILATSPVAPFDICGIQTTVNDSAGYSFDWTIDGESKGAGYPRFNLKHQIYAYTIALTLTRSDASVVHDTLVVQISDNAAPCGQVPIAEGQQALWKVPVHVDPDA